MSENSRERSPFSEAVAAQIRAERGASGMTQRETYEHAGLPKSTYIRLEQGTRVADMTQIARLCTVWGIPTSQFFHRVEDRMAQGESA